MSLDVAARWVDVAPAAAGNAAVLEFVLAVVL